MRSLILAAALAATPAWANPHMTPADKITASARACTVDAVIFYPTGDEPLVGHIEVTNLVCYGGENRIEWTMQTHIGDIAVVYDQTPNGNCTPDCPDHFQIWSLPDGYTSVPGGMTIAEKTTERIAIYKYLGT